MSAATQANSHEFSHMSDAELAKAIAAWWTIGARDRLLLGGEQWLCRAIGELDRRFNRS